MKKIFNILATMGLGLAALSCQTKDVTAPAIDPVPVSDLSAVASDEEVLLEWTAPQKAEPEDYQLTYMDGTAKRVAYTGGKTSILVGNLSNGTEYVFSIRAVYEDSILSEAAVVSATPTNKRQSVEEFSAAADDQIVHLSWKAVEGALSYAITCSAQDAETLKFTAPADATSYDVVNLENDVEYSFTIAVYYKKGVSETTSACATPRLARFPVKDLAAAVSDESVRLNWTSPSVNVLEYRLTIVAEGSEDVVVNLEKDATSYEAKSLTNGVSYQFVLAANYLQGWSENTVVSAKPVLTRIPVTGLSAQADAACVTLSWTAPKSLEGFPVQSYRIGISGSERTVTAPADATTAIVGELANGTEYEFSVVALYETGESVPAKVSATPVCRPVTNLKATAGDAEVLLEWESQSSRVTGFTVNYGQGQQLQAQPDATSITVTGLTNDQEYTFSVVANYGTDVSEPVEVKCTPVSIIPWTVSRTDIFGGETVTFNYDNSLLPASDIKWNVSGKEYSGASLSCPVEADDYAVASNKAQTVTVVLSANVGGVVKTWDISLNVTPYLFIRNDWKVGSGHNGFKADVPVFSPDGKTVYVMTFNKKTALYALDARTGEKKWSYETAYDSYNGKTVNPVTGVVYFGCSTAGHFYAVNPDGSLKWENTSMGAFNTTSFPAVSKDGSTVYVHDASKKLYALNAETGDVIWTKTMLAKGSGLLVNGDELMVASCCTTGGVKFLKASDGSEIASLDLPANGSDCAGIAVSPDRTKAYVTTNAGHICMYDLAGHTQLVQMSPEGVSDNIWELAVSPSGDVFGGSKAGIAFCYSGDLSTKKWIENYKVKNAYNYGHPCCDASGRFMITAGGTGNRSAVYSPDGSSFTWKFSKSNNQKQMAGNAYHNGILYSIFIGGGTENGCLVAKYVGGEDAASGWPCHGGDICGSCCIK